MAFTIVVHTTSFKINSGLLAWEILSSQPYPPLLDHHAPTVVHLTLHFRLRTECSLNIFPLANKKGDCWSPGVLVLALNFFPPTEARGSVLQSSYLLTTQKQWHQTLANSIWKVSFTKKKKAFNHLIHSLEQHHECYKILLEKKKSESYQHNQTTFPHFLVSAHPKLLRNQSWNH